MQPTLILRAPHPGLIYLNGRFAGEVGPDDPLLRPVQPRGAVYLEYRPLSNACHSMARKLVLSGGEPLPQSAEEAEGADIVLWPGGEVEIELSPSPRRGEARRFHAAGRSFSLDADGRLLCEGRTLGPLPAGAEVPEYRPLPGGAALIGRCEGGSYLLTADAEFRTQTGLLRGQTIELAADGSIRVVTARADLVGHAVLEVWRLAPEGLTLASSESAWSDGAPRWPKTAAETARAAVEAALAGLDGEAEGYLSESLRAAAPLRGIRERCDLCVEMRYAPPDPRPCVGLLTLLGDNLARVRPLYYRASPAGGLQGPYKIEEFAFE